MVEIRIGKIIAKCIGALRKLAVTFSRRIGTNSLISADKSWQELMTMYKDLHREMTSMKFAKIKKTNPQTV